MNMLISINIASIRPTKRTKDMNKSKNKALAYIKKIVQGIYIAEKNTKEAKKIKHSNRRSAMFITN
jgi:hypothetical protein